MQTPQRLIIAMSLVLMGGCAATAPVPDTPRHEDAWLRQAVDCCQTLAGLPATPLASPGEVTLAFGPHAPVHRFETGKSPFHALTLPRQQGPLELVWTSDVARDAQGHLSVFAPSILVLDERGQVQRRFGWQDFVYQPAKGLRPDRLRLAFAVTPGEDADRVVIMTSEHALANDTQLLHPERARARARHLAEPAIRNPRAQHRAQGEVELTVKPLGEGEGLLAPLLGTSKTRMSQGKATVTEADAAAADVSPPALEGLDFRRLMRAALAADDIALAMELAERAERAGDSGARAWLAEQLQAK
ncbi:MalM family protein [Halomonas sp. WWR20]